MPAYNFKAQFAVLVESGEKRQTVRRKRKRPTRTGDTLFLYTGLRTAKARLLRKDRCAMVKSIYISRGITVIGGEMLLSQAEYEAFARADGFATHQDFLMFFQEAYGLPFEGEVITW